MIKINLFFSLKIFVILTLLFAVLIALSTLVFTPKEQLHLHGFLNILFYSSSGTLPAAMLSESVESGRNGRWLRFMVFVTLAIAVLFAVVTLYIMLAQVNIWLPTSAFVVFWAFTAVVGKEVKRT